jgi:hypothetical protein
MKRLTQKEMRAVRGGTGILWVCFDGPNGCVICVPADGGEPVIECPST